MQKRVFIIHGWEANPDSDWFPWLRNELEKKGFEVSVPEMPDTANPKMEAWIMHLKKTVGSPDENCYFVGHSLGCIAILRYLERLAAYQEIGGAVFVAGFSSGVGFSELDNFFTIPVNWEAVKKHCKNFIAINSDNDPVVELAQGEKFKEMLKAKLIVKHMGHFNEEGDHVTELPDALNALLEMVHK